MLPDKIDFYFTGVMTCILLRHNFISYVRSKYFIESIFTAEIIKTYKPSFNSVAVKIRAQDNLFPLTATIYTAEIKVLPHPDSVTKKGPGLPRSMIAKTKGNIRHPYPV